MTGFASTTITVSAKADLKVPVSLTLKSLNSRFFDTNCKVPYPLSNFEIEFVKLFKQQLYRGSIQFIIHVGTTDIFRGAIEPSNETIKGYLNALDLIKNKFNVQGTITLADLIQLPDIFNSYPQELDEQVKSQILTATKHLISSVITMQEAEGAALLADISARFDLLETEINAVEKSFDLVLNTQKQKVHKTLAELGMDESKLAEAHRSALYTVLDKLDIHEEIVRFKSHIAAFRKELQTKEVEKGKRLDFILQEMAREINTISAKCPDALISSHAINIKVELEKAREQAQNVI
jgi:uncharacterized protein (TIGR00255 family)